MSDKRPGKPRFLSSQRERFCQLIAFRGMTSSQAYREAYDVSDDTSPKTIWEQASRVRNDPEVVARIAKLQSPTIARGEVTLQNHLETLGELRDEARENGEINVAVTAEVQRGKAVGLYIEKRIEATGSLEDLVAGATPKHKSSPPVVARARSRRKKK